MIHMFTHVVQESLRLANKKSRTATLIRQADVPTCPPFPIHPRYHIALLACVEDDKTLHTLNKDTAQHGFYHGSTINPFFPSTSFLPLPPITGPVTPCPGLGRVGAHINFSQKIVLPDVDQVEVWRHGRISNQIGGCLCLGNRVEAAGAGHGHPLLRGRIADDVAQ